MVAKSRKPFLALKILGPLDPMRGSDARVPDARIGGNACKHARKRDRRGLALARKKIGLGPLCAPKVDRLEICVLIFLLAPIGDLKGVLKPDRDPATIQGNDDLCATQFRPREYFVFPE